MVDPHMNSETTSRRLSANFDPFEESRRQTFRLDFLHLTRKDACVSGKRFF